MHEMNTNVPIAYSPLSSGVVRNQPPYAAHTTNEMVVPARTAFATQLAKTPQLRPRARRPYAYSSGTASNVGAARSCSKAPMVMVHSVVKATPYRVSAVASYTLVPVKPAAPWYSAAGNQKSVSFQKLPSTKRVMRW